MTIKISTSGLDRMTKALEEVRIEGVRRAREELDAALERTADTSRDLAHVSHDHRHSGALKASQQVSSEHDFNGWTGTIAYADRGAQWEMGRDGDHAAFIDDLSVLSAEDFERALDAMFKPL